MGQQTSFLGSEFGILVYVIVVLKTQKCDLTLPTIVDV